MASLNPLIRPSSPLAADAWRPPTPYERFADFMTRLIAVPKERLEPVASLEDVKAFQVRYSPKTARIPASSSTTSAVGRIVS